MFKKNTRKRLLAGALATVMMLTMCPSWALAGDEDIAPLPLVDESLPVVDSAPVEVDTTKTPADSTPSEPEAKPAEGQDTAPAPSGDEANGGTDSTESGNNNASSDVSEDSKNNSQKNNAADSTPNVNDQPQDAADINDVSTASLDAVPYGRNDVKTIEAEYWITNAPATDTDKVNTLTISSDMDHITDEDGIPVTELAPPTRSNINGYETTVFWQARVQHILHQTTLPNDDKTQDGTEITRIRYKDGEFECCAKDSFQWTKFNTWIDQLVFYYLIRTEYFQMVQIDVSDWTVDKEDTLHPMRRSVTYQVIVKGGDDDGTDKLVASQQFWYNKALKVSSVRVRQTESEHYTIEDVVLEPDNLGKPTKNENGEYRFSLDLNRIKAKNNATVKIYVSATPHELNYVTNGGTLNAGSYSKGKVYPEVELKLPTDAEITRDGYTFDGWYDEANHKRYQTGDPMPNNDLTLTAHWNAKTPTPPVDPETTTPAKYFVLLPNRGKPDDNHDQGKEFYLPNATSNGGVEGKNTSTGYTGALTAAGVAAAGPNTGDDSTNGIYDVNGYGSDYLVKPTELGFFDEDNWSNGSYNDSSADISILGENFDVKNIEIVWYTIKNQDDGYHVDGYVKNVAINVTYHSNFGTDATYNDPTRTGTYYTALNYYPANELPTRDGYEFRGWYTDAACNTPYTAKVLMNTLDLYAKWVPTNFKVSYYVDGVQDGEIEDHAVDSVVSQRGKLTKEGHTFSGWTPAADVANIIQIDANGHFTMPAQNVRFNGTFAINRYNVIYKVDDKVDGDPDVYDFNADVVIRDVPTKEGYTFKGWTSDDAAFDNGGFKMPARNVTIKGTFAINSYTVTYKVDNEVVGTEVYNFNSDVVIRNVPTKEGYTFSGWKIGTADAKNFKMPADNVVIEGTFAKNSSGGHHHRRPTVTIPDKVPTGLNGDDHYAYIVGYPDKTVRPQNGITRAEVATIFFRLLTDETRDANSTKSNSYSDVAAGAWYNHAVSTLSAMGIVKGDSNGKFNPNAPITRAEFAAIAARFDDKANTTTADFSDIASHWAKNEISAASNNGWITGYPDGTFRPDNKITRAEAMTLVNRVLKRLPETEEDLHDDMIKWSDNSDVSQWFYLDVQEATNSHYYQTKENQFEKWTKLRDTRDWTELEK